MAKEMYIGANGGYVVQKIQGDIIPKTWTQVTAGTSYKASDGTKLTASSVFSTSAEGADSACDGNTSTDWYGKSSTTSWIKLEFPKEIEITKMKVRIGNLGGSYGGAATIQGSKNNSSWTDLASTTTSGTLHELTLSNAAEYKYYRIYITFTTALNASVYEWQVSEYVGEAYDSSIPNIAHKVTKAYIGVDGKARKVKKGYIGVGGVAKLFYNPPTIFTSNPAPTGFSGGLTEGTDSNSWGTWTISADVQNSGYYPKDAFDGDTSTHFTASSIGTSTGTRTITLNCPSGVYIKPSHIQFVGARLGTVTFTGVTESDARVTFGTKTGSTTSNETMNIYPTTDQWFKSFRVETTRYSSSYKQPWFTEFQIVSGEIRKD